MMRDELPKRSGSTQCPPWSWRSADAGALRRRESARRTRSAASRDELPNGVGGRNRERVLSS
jgi:hypothetical protein